MQVASLRNYIQRLKDQI